MRAKGEENFVARQSGDRKLKFYLAITALIVIIALAVALFPKGTGLSKCLGIFLIQNKDSCLLSLAISTNNQTICSYIQDSVAGSCYSSIALANISPSLCGKAGDNLSNANCVSQIANATSNPMHCNMLFEPYRDSCILGVSIHMASTATCGQIQNQSLQVACSSMINLKIAALTLNATYCPMISNDTNRSVVIPVINADRSLFSGSNQTQTIVALSGNPFMQENYSSRDLCYILLASGTHDQSFCSSTSVYAQGTCNYASSQNSTAFGNYSDLLAACNALPQYGMQCMEYAQLGEAIATKNLTLCSSLQNGLSSDCYATLASKYANATYCGYIKNATANNACLLQLNYSR